jgi:hypothetical protein
VSIRQEVRRTGKRILCTEAERERRKWDEEVTVLSLSKAECDVPFTLVHRVLYARGVPFTLGNPLYVG